MKDMSAVLMGIRRLAAHKKFDKVFLLAFWNPQLIAQLEQAGFSTSWENCIRLFEKHKSSVSFLAFKTLDDSRAHP